MNLSDVTPLILCWNESENIQRCLAALGWAKQIVIIDSQSSDETVEIASQFQNVKVVQHGFENHTAQWNFGLDQVATPWVLTLDADYICPNELPNELQALQDEATIYFARFKYLVFGKSLRATLYPPRAVLFPAKACRYRSDGHTQLLDTHNSSTGMLQSTIDHDDRKPLDRWIANQIKYAKLESIKIRARQTSELGWKDRLRSRIVFAPALVCASCLFGKLLILDGWRGIYYTLQRTFAELLLALELLDARLLRQHVESHLRKPQDEYSRH